jgi:signal peptide peptidase SppA
MADTFPLSVPTYRCVDSAMGLWAIWPGYFEYLRHSRVADAVPVPLAAASTPFRMVPGKSGKNLAVIEVNNVLSKAASFRGTSSIQIRQNIRQAAADPTVSGIMLAIDSPGGTVAGTADLVSDVKLARRAKPVYAQIQDLGASAAYWVASQADQVFANDKTALVGSIGTLMTVYDMSLAAEKEGIKPFVFATGPLKGAGTPGAPLTDGQQAYFQQLVDDSQASFDAAVRTGRGMSAADLAKVRTGGVFTASQALELKLIDGIRSIDRTLEALAQAQ